MNYSPGNTAILRDTASGKTIHTFAGHTWTIRRIRFTRDGSRVITAGSDNTVRVWDVANGKPVASTPAPQK